MTGNAGFSGQHLIDHLRSLSPPPRIIGFDQRSASRLAEDQQIVGDLGTPDAVRGVLEDHRPTHVIHLAGSIPPATDGELWAGNVGLSVNLLEAIRTGPRPFPTVLLIGSAAEYGPAAEDPITEEQPCSPTTAYGRAKLTQTLVGRQYVQEWGLPIVIARPFNLIGPGMSQDLVVGTLCAQLAAAEPAHRILLGNISSARDFLDVRDAVAAFWLLVNQRRAGEIYNVCSGKATTIAEVAEQALAVSGRHVELRSDPGRLRQGDVDRSCGDRSKLSNHTGWKPRYDLVTSLRDTLSFFEGGAVGRTR